MMTSLTTMAGPLTPICPSAGSMPMVPSAPVPVFSFQVSPGLALRAGAASLITSGPGSSTASGTSGKPRPSIKSMTPSLPNFGSGRPVFASSDAMWYPGVVTMTRSTLPSVQ